MGAPPEEDRVLRRWIRRSEEICGRLPGPARGLFSSSPLVEIELRPGQVRLRPLEVDPAPGRLGRDLDPREVELAISSGARGW